MSASLQTAVAVGCVALALTWPVRASAPLRWLSGLSFGIYLVHPAIYAILLMVWRLEPNLATFALVCAGSIVAVLVLKRLWPAVV